MTVAKPEPLLRTVRVAVRRSIANITPAFSRRVIFDLVSTERVSFHLPGASHGIGPVIMWR
jgi:hypothetical protein